MDCVRIRIVHQNRLCFVIHRSQAVFNSKHFAVPSPRMAFSLEFAFSALVFNMAKIFIKIFGGHSKLCHHGAAFHRNRMFMLNWVRQKTNEKWNFTSPEVNFFFETWNSFANCTRSDTYFRLFNFYVGLPTWPPRAEPLMLANTEH